MQLVWVSGVELTNEHCVRLVRTLNLEAAVAHRDKNVSCGTGEARNSSIN